MPDINTKPLKLKVKIFAMLNTLIVITVSWKSCTTPIKRNKKKEFLNQTKKIQ